ncbi:MAG: hypothetical protein K2Y14_01235 [Burkholderiales bacterium]|nr:hypothetical protein [Burkholderiales bacterium]
MSISITTVADEVIKISKANLSGTYFNLFYLNSRDHSSATFKGVHNLNTVFRILSFLANSKIISIDINNFSEIKTKIEDNLTRKADQSEHIELSA